VVAQFPQQDGAFVVGQRPDIRAAHGRSCDRHARTDVELHTKCQPVTALPEIDHAVTIATADGDGATGLAHYFFTVGLGQMPNAEIGERSIPERHG
jgi:hypothetical protein